MVYNTVCMGAVVSDIIIRRPKDVSLMRSEPTDCLPQLQIGHERFEINAVEENEVPNAELSSLFQNRCHPGPRIDDNPDQKL